LFSGLIKGLPNEGFLIFPGPAERTICHCLGHAVGQSTNCGVAEEYTGLGDREFLLSPALVREHVIDRHAHSVATFFLAAQGSAC
jgi:hypothetical protein